MERKIYRKKVIYGRRFWSLPYVVTAYRRRRRRKRRIRIRRRAAGGGEERVYNIILSKYFIY